MNGFEDFDRYCEEHKITDEELPAAFGAWLNEKTGWDGDMNEVDQAPLDAYFPTFFDDLDGVRVRKSDPLASHFAADSNSKEHRTAVENAVLNILSRAPLTDERLTAFYFINRERLGWPQAHGDSIRKRRSDLMNRGLVEDSGLVGVTKSGRKAVKWRAV